MNDRLVNHMLNVCDLFEREISIADLQYSLKSNGSATEGVDKSFYSKVCEYTFPRAHPIRLFT